ncbi:MAG: ECF transporter S component [Armatimonadota bacterium]
MSVRKITWSAFFICAGIVLPLIFHMFGLGRALLPMHIPVFIAGLFMGPLSGFFVGFLTPALSSALTGMPPLMPPVALMMMVELPIYAVISALLYRRFKVNIYISLISAMVTGRVIYGACAYLLFPLVGLKEIPIFYPITAGVVFSLPGIILQILIVPPVVKLLEKHVKFNDKN